MAKKPDKGLVIEAAQAAKHEIPTGDGVALQNVSHPEGDYEDGRLYVYDGGSQVFLPHAVLDETAIVDDKIEVMLTDVQVLVVSNQVAIMKALHLVIKQTIGDYESLKRLEDLIKASETVLNA